MHDDVTQLTPDEVRAIIAERDKLAAFKAFVHARLDEGGVPTHPDGPHSKQGCRIGDRLDLLLSYFEPAGPDGLDMIVAERFRQVGVHGYPPDRDDQHTDGQLLACAERVISGVLGDRGQTAQLVTGGWPRVRAAHVKEKYGADYKKRLTIAGALVAAEIDRLIRREKSPAPPA